MAEASWAWDSLGYLATGVSGGWPASEEADILVDLVYALKAGYRQNASWVMNRKTQAAVRKLKDGDGNYLWQPGTAPTARATLMGFDLVEAEDMPDIGANTTPIRRLPPRLSGGGPHGGERAARPLRGAKPYVLFYTTKRVGGGVQDFDAIKLLKFGTS